MKFKKSLKNNSTVYECCDGHDGGCGTRYLLFRGDSLIKNIQHDTCIH